MVSYPQPATKFTLGTRELFLCGNFNFVFFFSFCFFCHHPLVFHHRPTSWQSVSGFVNGLVTVFLCSHEPPTFHSPPNSHFSHPQLVAFVALSLSPAVFSLSLSALCFGFWIFGYIIFEFFSGFHLPSRSYGFRYFWCMCCVVVRGHLPLALVVFVAKKNPSRYAGIFDLKRAY